LFEYSWICVDMFLSMFNLETSIIEEETEEEGEEKHQVRKVKDSVSYRLDHRV
jgi:hypothetical protein